MSDPLTPAVGLLCKLGSIAVHVDELLSPSGHAFDRSAIENLINDLEVRGWLEQMDEMALLPKRRGEQNQDTKASDPE